MRFIQKKLAFQIGIVCASLSGAYVAPVSAHGYMEYPQDYANSCFKGSTTDSELCNDTVSNQKNEINNTPGGDHKAVIADGQLCSASKGGVYSVLDVPSANRYATELELDANGEFEIVYTHTAPHRTWYWDIFVTRDGFDPDTEVLTWDDLERLTVIDGYGEEPNATETFKVKWPEGKTGKHIIYQVWQRPDVSHTHHEVLGAPPENVWDSPEAFYSCANVIVGDHNPVPEPDESPWVKSEAFAIESFEVAAGDRVKARLMHSNSEEFEVFQDITSSNENDDIWKLDLARAINDNPTISEYVQVGVLNDDGEVLLSDDPAKNYIHYVSKEWSHLVEKLEQDGNDTSIAWVNGESQYELAEGETLSIPVEVAVENGEQGIYDFTVIMKAVGATEPEQVVSGTTDAPVSLQVSELGEYTVRVTGRVDGALEQANYEFSVIAEQGDIEYDYLYPEGFGNYVAGDVVKFEGEGIYECYGPWAAHCNDEAFLPGVASDPNWVEQQWRKLD
ncbi:chitin binding protein [Vibrio ishigakensis]|uniref:Chitin binding protein n=1 Tax=Vibrio ishigakensis TaxID=1481914 RepID=A0A0B8P4R0_9VIBR|nr:chitin binding protein [Vibrio ishigakensis]